MSWLRLAIANLRLSPLTATVNVLLMALGTASIVLLLLVGTQLSDTMSRNARGIDLVLGAKGSPVQLVLATVYHADMPPGNIRLESARRWTEDPRIERAIPLSLGDSFRGFRIVGTSPEYAAVYDAVLASGQWWSEPMQAVAGSAAAQAAQLGLGATFASAHGFSSGGHAHAKAAYQVVGVLEPTGTVLDRLLLTSLESVWQLHDDDASHDASTRNADPHAVHDHDDAHHDDHDGEHGDHDHDHEVDDAHQHEHDAEREVTAFLLRYRSPTSAVSMPRQINTSSNLLAAAPAMEVARVLQMVGIGLDGLRAFAWVLVVSAGLSIFAALYGSLRSRRGDIAMLRCLGATRWELFFALMLEGLVLASLGVALGFAAGHVVVDILGSWLQSARGVTLSGRLWLPAETALVGVLIAVGIVAAAIPALQAYRTDVAKTLAEAP